MDTTLPYLTLLFYAAVFGATSLVMLVGALREINPQLITASFTKAAGFFVLAVTTGTLALALHSAIATGAAWDTWVFTLFSVGAWGALMVRDGFRASDREFARVMANHFDRI